MKKPHKKQLALAPETVRNLSNAAMQEVTGGRAGISLKCTTPTYDGTCEPA